MIPTIDAEFQELIPRLLPHEFAQLEENILSDGCRDPLVVWNATPDVLVRLGPYGFCKGGGCRFERQDVPTGEWVRGDGNWTCPDCGWGLAPFVYVLLDGHNRYNICTRNGLTFKTTEVELENGVAAADWIDANQLGRRNLTPDQARLLTGRRYNRAKKAQGAQPGHEGVNQYTSLSGQSVHSSFPKTAEVIAEQHGVDERTVRRNGVLAEFVDGLPIEQQRAIRDGEVKISAVKRDLRREEVAKFVASPEAKYRVIYADPPWAYRDTCDEGSIQAQGAARKYPTMTIEELCALPVKDWCEDNAVLFLWVTSPFLSECWPVIEAWGFTYKASFVWDKIKHNMGHYNSVRHEFLLVCTKGSCTPDVVQLFDSVQSIERTEHSVKPEEFRTIIDTLYPNGKRLEMFARRDAGGAWETWGNEA